MGSGAAKVGKRVAQSEAGRSATRAAVKGATDAAVKDVSDRYLGGPSEVPPSATPTQSVKTSVPSSTKSTSAPPTKPSHAPTPPTHHHYHDDRDSDEEFEEMQRKIQYLPPKPSKLNRFKPVINFKSKEKVNSSSKVAPPQRKPKDKIYKYSLAKEADWSSLQKAVALYNFKGIMNCDLEFCKGQWIEVITRTEDQFDWWEGRINDRVGIFPANYVRIV